MTRVISYVSILACLGAVAYFTGLLQGEESGPPAPPTKPHVHDLEFENYKGADGHPVWRLKPPPPTEPSHEPVPHPPVIDDNAVPKPTHSELRFEVYLDGPGEYRWRLRSANGQVVAVSWRPFGQKYDAMKSIAEVRTGVPDAKTYDLTR